MYCVIYVVFVIFNGEMVSEKYGNKVVMVIFGLVFVCCGGEMINLDFSVEAKIGKDGSGVHEVVIVVDVCLSRIGIDEVT